MACASNFPIGRLQLPDFPFLQGDPEGFATSAEIVDFLTAYAVFIDAPVRSGVTVTALRGCEGASGFRAETSAGAIEAGNVVVATGPYQRP
jgi:putative flavoprotein involved in K+ transport